ncbi:hypothetical protein FSP39_016447 [Pinctada imbricata]|uniref:Uncharacterized protein n=1 Tax=Pinctada imbricata TaxID=66713 RepID=A0AA88YEV4_PINIB|nr:hypothetical protein FSP39_016447 [Pinctada imbricata]
MSFTWADQNGKLSSIKTSTCVLFDPDGQLHSVGYDAEEKYSELADEVEHTDWFFFRRFKMNLYKQKKFDRDSVLCADNGEEMNALVVFSAVIRYLKGHMKKECDKRMSDILDSEIKWVLTVPAIWTDSAKQFMREAAEKAGIDSHQLSLALEPEAAALFCRYSSIEKQGGEIIKMAAKTKYMVLDCGGGTVDITIHEVLGSKYIKEIYKANGGSWGGTTVDNAFWEILQEVLGGDVIDEFKSDHKYHEMEIINTFEIKKRYVDENTVKDIILSVPSALEDTVKKKHKKPIAKVLEANEKYNGKLKGGKGRLRISPDLFRSFFDYACTSIVGHLRDLLNSPQLESVDTILMVGGFSESPILQHAIKTSFSSIRVLVPHNASIAVLNGAVLCGHEPETVHSRVCRFTYGVEIALPFEDGVDKRSYRFKDTRNRTMCHKRFKVIVNEGDEVAIDSASTFQLIEVEGRDHFHFTLPVFVSENGCPRYTTECTKIGEVKIDSNDACTDDIRTFKVEMVFGYIESRVKVTDIKAKKSVSAKFDFLG